MNTLNKSYVGAEVYAQVEQVPMSALEREKALATLRSADTFLDVVVWAIKSIKRLFAGDAPKAGLRNKLAA